MEDTHRPSRDLVWVTNKREAFILVVEHKRQKARGGGRALEREDHMLGRRGQHWRNRLVAQVSGSGLMKQPTWTQTL
jgi:hypothetical protein